MRALFQPPRTVLLILLRLGLLAALVILIPAAIYSTGRPEVSSQLLPVTNLLDPHADLNLKMAVSTGQYYVGKQITFTLSVNNLGPSNATKVVLTGILPPQVRLVSTTPLNACSGTTTIACNLGTLTRDASRQVILVVSADTPGTIANRFSVSAAETDPVNSNNTAQANASVKAVADLHLALAASASQITPGEQLTYLLTISNSGPDAASGILLTGLLPPQVSLVSTQPAGICSGTSTFTCSLGSLADGKSTQWSLVVSANTSGLATISAAIASQEVDPHPVDNSALILTTIKTPVNKVFLPLIDR